MWMFWVIAMLCLLAYVLQRPSGAQGEVLFWVSIFFQGVALPVLAFVSNEQGDRTNTLLKETHDRVLEEFESIRNVQAVLLEELAEIKALSAEIKALSAEMRGKNE
jgi:hypothetical protein